MYKDVDAQQIVREDICAAIPALCLGGNEIVWLHDR